MKVTVILIIIGSLGTVNGIDTGTGGLKTKKKSRHHPRSSIVNIG